jgi:AcrR family transcriptional regulator
MPNQKRSKGELTRQAIIESAYNLFLKQGYAATSMRQIAKGSGLALGGIYNHFPRKETIFSELILERHPYRQILLILVNTPSDNVEDFVRKAATAMVNELGKRPDFIKLMLIEMVEFNGRNMQKIMNQVYPEIQMLIEKFKLELTPSIPLFIFFRAFLGLFFSYYMTELLLTNAPASLVSAEPLDHFIEIFLHGILTNKEPE